jgi:phage terminase small subunit
MLADGKSAAEAYRGVGYQPNRQQASKLRHRHDIARRVEEIMAQRHAAETKADEDAAHRLGIDRTKTLAEMAKLGFQHLGQIWRKHPDEFTEAEWCMVKKIKYQETGGRTRSGRKRPVRRNIEIEIYDKGLALERIGRHLGMFVHRVDSRNMNVNLNYNFDATDAEL